ncbi:menaquinone biosynthesis family protein [Helicobacter anatolicus]|uniref:menaquinone biosynthesis family protein n=1 Tax=Helicobacter anatolicus TaxID=2905874 RepID=UPI001E2B0856|nr:MqnA/MqnD/SBP family protein [Helicobacter anatolicus]MCE3039194.1 S-ribosylhomocysteine lyase [Helicobacter anatolicus]
MISVGHSPDADDLFMYYAIVFGWVDSALNQKFENIALDIQTLNEKALMGELDVSAISFALYPLIKDQYALLRTGVSFGNGYGPKLVKKKGVKLKKNFKVALSGKHTSNALIFRIFYPEARIIYKNFLEIEQAVLSGEVDAGVLIHESILCYDDALEVEVELWDIWQELVKENLPLPLGGMALRRSIPLNKAIDIEKTLIKAVDVALKGKKTLSQMLMQKGIIRVDSQKLDIYLNLYANKDSVILNSQQKKGLEKMFKLGYDAKIYDRAIKNCDDYLIPMEYESLRFN